MIRVGVFVGTRPDIIKMTPVVKLLQRERNIQMAFINTGQHYSRAMNASFLAELGLPKPRVNLNVESGVFQFSKSVLRSTTFLSNNRPDIVLVEGDTNSAAGVAVAANKLGIPVGHVEAGCRSFDRRMPEEINRCLIADCAELNFAPTKTCRDNLLRERVDPTRIFLTGHPIVELVREMIPKIRLSNITEKLGLDSKGYVMLTLHRPETVDTARTLSRILQALKPIPRRIVFPVHPRTRLRLKQFGILKSFKKSGVQLIPPLPYVQTLRLITDSETVLTDSGGIQQECALLRAPCITIRASTEWVETVKAGVNFLAPPLSKHFDLAVARIYRKMPEIEKRFKRRMNFFGDASAAKKIVAIIKSRMVK